MKQLATRTEITNNARNIMRAMLEGMKEGLEELADEAIYFEAHKQVNQVIDTTYEVVDNKQLPEGQADPSS